MSARAYRVSPRRSTGARRTRIHWDRLGRIALVLVFFAILFSYISPVMNFVDAWRGSHETDSQLAELKNEHDRLEAKAVALKSPNAVAEAARRSGMVLNGEHSFVVKNLPH
ncbi:MAG: septum formation initiator family protein [Solirubrobacterales bacterium]